MKKFIFLLLLFFCSACHAITEAEMPHIFIDPRGYVLNYADMYRVDGGETIIRYYFDSPSINRLTVMDRDHHSYSLNTIVRTQLREALLIWRATSGNNFTIEQVNNPGQANLAIYGLPTYLESRPYAIALGAPPGMEISPSLPGNIDNGRIYIINANVQTALNDFQANQSLSTIRFRQATGITQVADFLPYQILLGLVHEIGHTLGFAHPDGSRDIGGGFTQRPLMNELPTPVLPGAQIMNPSTTDYLVARSAELQRTVGIRDIEPSIQEQEALRFLWHLRGNDGLECTNPSPSTRALQNITSLDQEACFILPTRINNNDNVYAVDSTGPVSGLIRIVPAPLSGNPDNTIEIPYYIRQKEM